MEPQENYICYDNKLEKCSKKIMCLWIILVILLTAFSFVIGLLVGAALATVDNCSFTSNYSISCCTIIAF